MPPRFMIGTNAFTPNAMQPNTAVRMQTEKGNEQIVNNYGASVLILGRRCCCGSNGNIRKLMPTLLLPMQRVWRVSRDTGMPSHKLITTLFYRCVMNATGLPKFVGDWPIFGIASAASRKQCGFRKLPRTMKYSTRLSITD